MAKYIEVRCPEYVFTGSLSLEAVSNCIDVALRDKFENRKVVLRGIQSDRHSLPKQKLIKHILDTGTDRYDFENINEVKVSEKPLDLFGLACVVEKKAICLPILEGFHKWKPKSLERPQCRVDIWMVYDATKLINVEYTHTLYGVKAKDGYLFVNPKNKQDTLLGVIVVN